MCGTGKWEMSLFFWLFFFGCPIFLVIWRGLEISPLVFFWVAAGFAIRIGWRDRMDEEGKKERKNKMKEREQLCFHILLCYVMGICMRESTYVNQ